MGQAYVMGQAPSKKGTNTGTNSTVWPNDAMKEKKQKKKKGPGFLKMHFFLS